MKKDELDIQTGLNTAKAYKMLWKAVAFLGKGDICYSVDFKNFECILHISRWSNGHSLSHIAVSHSIIASLKACKPGRALREAVELVLHIVKGDNLEDFYGPKFIASLKKPVDPISYSAIAGIVDEINKLDESAESFCTELGGKIGREIDELIEKHLDAMHKKHDEYIAKRKELIAMALGLSDELKNFHEMCSSENWCSGSFDTDFLNTNEEGDNFIVDVDTQNFNESYDFC